MISLICDTFACNYSTEIVTVSYPFKCETNQNVCIANDFVFKSSKGFVIEKAKACLLWQKWYNT